MFRWKKTLEFQRIILIKVYTHNIDDLENIISNRKISTYINALAGAGFMIEQTNDETLSMTGDLDERSLKAKVAFIDYL